MLFALIACASDNLVVPADTSPVIDEELWAGASMVVESPTSGQFIPVEDGGEFTAYLLDEAGDPIEFDDIVWTTNQSEWTLTGSALDDDTLGVAVHDLTATAELPNGDRLSHTIGGVLVQSHYAGTYTGDMKVNMAAQGVEVGCSGAATIVIDPTGTLVQGSSGCLLSLQGFEIDSAFVLNVANDDGDLSGDIAVEVYGYELPMAFEGDVSEEGEMTGAFAGDVFGQAEFDGVLTVSRISRETTTFAN